MHSQPDEVYSGDFASANKARLNKIGGGSIKQAEQQNVYMDEDMDSEF